MTEKFCPSTFKDVFVYERESRFFQFKTPEISAQNAGSPVRPKFGRFLLLVSSGGGQFAVHSGCCGVPVPAANQLTGRDRLTVS